jgi:hypothetical protein
LTLLKACDAKAIENDKAETAVFNEVYDGVKVKLTFKNSGTEISI